MREIKIVVAACVVLLFASFAAAQVPTSGNVFFGYSYYNADLSTLGRSNLSGWTGRSKAGFSPTSAWWRISARPSVLKV